MVADRIMRCVSDDECPLWVISGQTVADQNPPLSALVQKRTKTGTAGLSAMCQKRPTHRSKQHRYSINSSAATSNVDGKVMPRALAALTLITNGNFVGSWTGRLAGFAPLRIRSM